MNDADMSQALQVLRNLKRAGCFEAYQVTTFTGYRNDEAGEQREITVKVLDAGEDAGDLRYSVQAQDDDDERRFATGNPASSIDLAFSTVHWWDLEPK